MRCGTNLVAQRPVRASGKGAPDGSVPRAFGTPRFADQVCNALDESTEAIEGAPTSNAGLSVLACTDVMEQLIQKTDAQANVNLLCRVELRVEFGCLRHRGMERP